MQLKVFSFSETAASFLVSTSVVNLAKITLCCYSAIHKYPSSIDDGYFYNKHGDKILRLVHLLLLTVVLLILPDVVHAQRASLAFWKGSRASNACTGTPWGTVSSGYSNTAYSTSTPAGTCASVSQTRTCTAGTMSGTYTNTSCTAGCTGTPWGSVASGYSNTAYSSSTPAGTCASVSQTRTCTAGTMSGTYTNTSCTNGCAAGTATWLANCSASVAALSSGSGTSATNTASGYTGSATVTCNSGSYNYSGTSCSAISCGGVSVGGYCWYTDTVGAQSCDAICASHGGCNISGTRDYAGSGGTLANCRNVENALGWGADAVDSSIAWGNGIGCSYVVGCWGMCGDNERNISTTTTCAATYSDSQGWSMRICACNN